jgi:hypothetical protein
MRPSDILQSIYYPDIRTTFSRICPDLRHDGKESTRTKQQQRLNPTGLTIVARIQLENEVLRFNDATEKIQTESGRTFCSGKCLHFTLLGLLNDRRKADQYFRGRITYVAKEFIEQKHLGSLKYTRIFQ